MGGINYKDLHVYMIDSCLVAINADIYKIFHDHGDL